MGETLTLRYLSRINHISKVTLHQRFKPYLQSSPSPPIYLEKTMELVSKREIELSGYLHLDGNYFGRGKNKSVLIVYWDSLGGLLYWSWNTTETKEQIEKDLNLLVNQYHYPLKGIISDGKRGVKTIARELETPHQRCLVHVRRAIEAWLTKHPQTQTGKELLELIQFLTFLETKPEVIIWLLWFRRLWQRHREFINQRTVTYNLKLQRYQWWYTHKYLRRAYYHLKYALPDLFTFLSYPNLPRTNNALEGFFSQLDNKISIHRGLSPTNRKHFINWFLYFRRFKQKPTLNS